MTIHSAGYGSRTFDDFTSLLKEHGLTHVVDVRSTPYSNYQVEFRRENLVKLIPEAGLRYVYMGDTLGGVVSRGEDDASKATFQMGLDRLLLAASDPSKKLCLMCGCLLPHKCHRGAVLGAALTARGVEYLHLDREGAILTQAQLELELFEPQGALF